MNASALGLTMESNGIRILEPFDTTISYSNALGKTNIHLSVSDIFMNFSFSILKLFLAVEEDILAFLRMAGKKMTVVCSQFDKVGSIKSMYALSYTLCIRAEKTMCACILMVYFVSDSGPYSDQVYAFWRPHAPPGFAVLGDYLTPLSVSFNNLLHLVIGILFLYSQY